MTITTNVIFTKKDYDISWWDYKELIYYTILPRNRTINSDVYTQQLIKLKKQTIIDKS